MNFTEREERDLEEIHHLSGLEEHAEALLKLRGVELDSGGSAKYLTKYDSARGEVSLTYTLTGTNIRAI